MKEPINISELEKLSKGQQEVAISNMIIEVHDWLSLTDDSTPITRFATTRTYMQDLQVAVRHLDLSKELLLDATMVLRMAERAVGKAVRRGQRAGEIGTLSTNQMGRKGSSPESPIKYIGSGTTAKAIYSLVDGWTDAQFTQALKQARFDGRLSRPYVVSKLVEITTGKSVDKRSDVVEISREVAEQLRKVTVRLNNLSKHDRLKANKAEVAARMRPYLATAVEVCTALSRMLEEE